MKFRIEVEMKDRWVPHFMGMLKLMQKYGSWGSSRVIGFYSDGDGDFNPKFEFDFGAEIMLVPAEPLYEDNKPEGEKVKCESFFDAG